ncbi:Uncharacterised protein [Klebsiella pneumoniae subsp. pneumoniae]|nr:Uncharacterised protein [Klebsiella pneumoniae subsp. pneumoniae]
MHIHHNSIFYKDSIEPLRNMFHAGKEIIIICNDTQFHYFLP